MKSIKDLFPLFGVYEVVSNAATDMLLGIETSGGTKLCFIAFKA